MQIFGFIIDNLDRKEISNKLLFFLNDHSFHRIVTINPEFLLLAQKDQVFARALSEADLRIADAVGIAFAFKLIGEKLRSRYPGADLMEEVLLLAAQKKFGVYIATRKYGLSTFDDVRKALSKKYPRLRIEGADYSAFDNTFPVTDCEVVLCNFGIPDQEIFLANLAKNPGLTRLAIGVGGSFDFLTKKIRRAPKFLRRIGLEWLWRLMLQPWRWKRMWSAVAIFPYRVWQDRKNVSGVTKKVDTSSPFAVEKK